MSQMPMVISHWHHLIEDFETSPLEFYAALEEAIARRQIPNKESVRISFQEGGLMTAHRRYLRFLRHRHAFDVCAAPFGSGFFFSWWLIERPSHWFPYFVVMMIAIAITVAACFRVGFIEGFVISPLAVPGVLAVMGFLAHAEGGSSEEGILAMPIIGQIYARVFDPPTYYKFDTALMFQDAVHNAVLEVVDQVTTPKGIRLSEFERKPVIRSFT